MSKKIGSIIGRITELAYPYYRVDFTRHNNAWDSDDEDDLWQWSHAIRFSYEHGPNGMIFLNRDEISYNTAERYTGRKFWSDDSTSIVRMIQDTMMLRKARGDPLPPWSLSSVYRAGDNAWDKYRRM